MIRMMRPGDVPRGLAFCRDNGWNQTLGDWNQLLALGGDGCIVAEVERLVVATLTAVRYERRFAWIGMVLVDRAMRGRGIATALMNQALAALGDIPARLDATPAGQPVYGRLGFVEESRLCRMTREAVSPGSPRRPTARRSRPMTSADLAQVLEIDRTVFGADRADLLRWAFTIAPALAWMLEGTPRLRGYCFGRPGVRWPQIGPIVAVDEDAGFDLVSAAAAGGRPVVIDASCAKPDWIRRLESAGFVEQRSFIRMRRGAAEQRCDEPGTQLAIFGPEWG